MSDPRLQGPGRNNDPDPYADLVGRMQKMQQQINDLSGALLKSAGIQAKPGKIASTDWDGSDHSALGTAGWVLGRDGAGASYLALNGIDLADLIASQIEFRSNWNRVTGFAVPSSNTEYVSTSIVVPDGYTEAHFDVVATLFVLNSTTSAHNLYGDIARQANGSGPIYGSDSAAVSVSAGWWTTLTVVYKYSDTVTPGNTIRFWLEAAPDLGSPAWAANASHRARIDATVEFNR